MEEEQVPRRPDVRPGGRRFLPLGQRVMRRMKSESDDYFEPRTSNIKTALIDIAISIRELREVSAMVDLEKTEQEKIAEKIALSLQKTLIDSIETEELGKLCAAIVTRANGGMPIEVENGTIVLTVKDVGVLREVLNDVLKKTKAESAKIAMGVLRPEVIRNLRSARLGPEDESGGKVSYFGWTPDKNGILTPQSRSLAFDGVPKEMWPTRILGKRDGKEEIVPNYAINRTVSEEWYLVLLELAKEERASGKFPGGKSTPKEIQAAVFLYALPSGLKRDWGEKAPQVELDEETRVELGLVRPAGFAGESLWVPKNVAIQKGDTVPSPS